METDTVYIQEANEVITNSERKVKKKKKKKPQSEIACFLESFSNEFIGYVLNTIIQILVFPVLGIYLSLSTNLITSGVHSFFGLSRIYIVRRVFSRYCGKKQSKKASALECLVNIVAGTIINFFATLWVYPLFGAVISTGNTFWITLVFLVVTLTRLYLIRRWFNAKIAARRKAKKAMKKALKAHKKQLLNELSNETIT